MFKIKFPTKHIVRIFPILRINGMAPFFMYRTILILVLLFIFGNDKKQWLSLSCKCDDIWDCQWDWWL